MNKDESKALREVVQVRVRGYRGLGFGARLIRWFTFGDFSHVSFEFRFARGKPLEVESIQGAGVRVREPRPECDVSRVVPISRDQANALWQMMVVMARRDLKYDWTGIWGFIRRAKRQNPHKWFCSELIAWALAKVLYPISRREPYRETPSTVMESLRLVADKDIQR